MLREFQGVYSFFWAYPGKVRVTPTQEGETAAKNTSPHAGVEQRGKSSYLARIGGREYARNVEL